MTLGAKLPEVFLKALETARKIQDASDRAKALIVLVDKLPDDLMSEVLEVAYGLMVWGEVEHDDYAGALILLGDNRPEALPKVLEIAYKIQDEEDFAETLTVLRDKLPDYLLPKALAAALKIQDAKYRAKALTALGDRIPEALPKALEAACKIQDAKYRVEALAALGDKLPEVLPEALKIACKIRDAQSRVYALIDLVDKLPETFLKVLEAVREVSFEDFRSDRLYELKTKLTKLPESLLPKALEVACSFPREWDRAEVLTQISDALNQSSRQTCQEIYPKILRALGTCHRSSTLGALTSSITWITTLGGKSALRGIFKAINDVSCWWP